MKMVSSDAPWVGSVRMRSFVGNFIAYSFVRSHPAKCSTNNNDHQRAEQNGQTLTAGSNRMSRVNNSFQILTISVISGSIHFLSPQLCGGPHCVQPQPLETALCPCPATFIRLRRSNGNLKCRIFKVRPNRLELVLPFGNAESSKMDAKLKILCDDELCEFDFSQFVHTFSYTLFSSSRARAPHDARRDENNCTDPYV